VISALQLHAAANTHGPAVIELHEGGRSCSWGQLMTLTAKRAESIRTRVRVGQTILTALPSGIESISWFLASIAAGVRVLPLHVQIAGAEAQSAIDRAGAACAVMAIGIRAQDVLSQLPSLIPDASDVHSDHCCMPTDMAGSAILESSGTSGLPKLALRGSAALDAVAFNIIAGLCLTSNDRIVFPTPLSHSYGIDAMVAAVTAGATLCVINQYDSDRVADALTSGATILLGTPFVYESLARRSPTEQSTMRIALSAGAPLLKTIGDQFHERWGITVGQLYGATELGTVAMSIPGSDAYAAGSIGHPLPQVSMAVMDLEDPTKRAPVQTEGQLAVKAPSMLTQYLDGEVDTVHGHLQTGDLARKDANDRFWITGRLKLMVAVGGYKVNPLEVEQLLLTHSAVSEAVVIPIVQSPTISRLRAVVILRECQSPPTPQQLRHFLKDRLSVAKVPRVINIVSSLPKSPTGKILRSQVMNSWS
jgi:acyl-CoA synthetase (AMP-forming)/AMP-acid ligase II